jgi:hypothetical protein
LVNRTGTETSSHYDDKERASSDDHGCNLLSGLNFSLISMLQSHIIYLILQGQRRCDVTIATLEGIVENGRIRLRDNVTLPENTKVYIVIPDLEPAPIVRVHSPRLAHPEQAGDFAKQVIEVSPDAEL